MYARDKETKYKFAVSELAKGIDDISHKMEELNTKRQQMKEIDAQVTKKLASFKAKDKQLGADHHNLKKRQYDLDAFKEQQED